MNPTIESQGMIIETPRSTRSPPGMPSTSFLGVFFDLATYRSILYLLLLMPVGIAIFTYSVTAASLTIGLAITILGLPLLYMYLSSLPYILSFQSGLTETVLGISMPSVHFKSPQGGFFDRFIPLIKKSEVQLGFISSILLLPVGIFTFVVTVTTLSVSLSLSVVILYPLVRSILYGYGVEFDGEIYLDWLPVDVPEMGILIPVSIIGLLLLTFSLHLIRAMAYAYANIVHKMIE